MGGRSSNEVGNSSDGSDLKAGMKCDQLYSGINNKTGSGIEDLEIAEGHIGQSKDKSQGDDEIVELVRNPRNFHL